MDLLPGYSLDVPAASLLMMGLGLFWLMLSASRRPDAFWSTAFKDDTGKVSWMRLAMLVALGVSSWHLIYVTMNVVKDGKDLAELYPFYATFLLVWSGAKVAEKAIDAVLAKFGIIKPAPQIQQP